MSMRGPLLCSLLSLGLVLACGDKDDDSGATADGGATSDGGSAGDGGSEGVDSGPMDPSFFEGSATFLGSETVDCDLEDGTRTTCWQLRFGANPIDSGPYCPETVEDIGGLGVYDGPTDPGFQLLAAPLWEAMEADGYDIVDPDGNIVIENPTTGAGGGPMLPAGGDPGGAACLEALADDELVVRIWIPVEPVVGSSVDSIESVELIGLTTDGVPFNGDPPSVVENGGKIPALDACGNHHDPTGYLHAHFGSPGADTLLQAYDIDEISCTHVAQDDTALVGFAKDGYPVYASQDMDGSAPADLDECRGHTAGTADFPDGVYHYHLYSDVAPSFPPCLKGVAAAGAFGLE